MKIGFIGCGNMGSALAAAVGKAEGRELYLSDRNREKRELLANALGATACESLEIAENCEVIFLAVKPNIIPCVIGEISGALSKNRNALAVVSIAAGISLNRLEAQLPEGTAVIRVMPNTPAAVGEGAILYCPGKNATEKSVESFLDIMKGAGECICLEEKLIDAASALSGCGPAFVYVFAEALADGAVSVGLPRDKADLLAAKTLLGAAKMLLEGGKHPGQLKDEVCSPGGSTIEGVRALEEGGFRAAAMNAVISAYEKTLALGK